MAADLGLRHSLRIRHADRGALPELPPCFEIPICRQKEHLGPTANREGNARERMIVSQSVASIETCGFGSKTIGRVVA